MCLHVHTFDLIMIEFEAVYKNSAQNNALFISQCFLGIILSMIFIFSESMWKDFRYPRLQVSGMCSQHGHVL